jgi:hypothetical protein
MKEYFLFRSERLNESSHVGPQNSRSMLIGVEHIMQCLCFGIVTFSACFMYFDKRFAPSFASCLIKPVDPFWRMT